MSQQHAFCKAAIVSYYTIPSKINLEARPVIMLQLILFYRRLFDMSMYEDNKEWLHNLMDMLEAHFGKDVEFVLHDLTKDYEHTIVDIRNGGITGREVGGTGDILGLEYLHGSSPRHTYFNQLEYTNDGKALRSSTLFINDKEGNPSLCIAINEDVTKVLEIENYIHSKANFTTKGEYYRGDVNDMLRHLMSDAQMQVGKPTSAMTKADKMKYIKYLDDHGAFLITYSNTRVCEVLNISGFTLYNYLKTIRGENKAEEET